MNKGGKFLKKLWWCVVGEYYKIIWNICLPWRYFVGLSFTPPHVRVASQPENVCKRCKQKANYFANSVSRAKCVSCFKGTARVSRSSRHALRYVLSEMACARIPRGENILFICRYIKFGGNSEGARIAWEPGISNMAWQRISGLLSHYFLRCKESSVFALWATKSLL